jgi:hypothetical protein
MAGRNSLKFKIPPFVPPSPYQPFLRRFTDERAADLADTKALHASVTQRFDASPWAISDAVERFNTLVAETVCKEVTVENSALAQALDRCTIAILAMETAIFRRPVVQNWHLSLKDQVDLRRFLRAQEHFLANDDHVSALLYEALVNIDWGLLATLPPIPMRGAFSVPLHVLCDLNDVLERIIGTLAKQPHADAGIFTAVNDRIYRNVCKASGVDPDADHRRPLVTPADSPLRGEALLETYLAGTPFLDLFRTSVPFAIPHQKFTEHTAIFAPTGGGKTVTLQALILDFLKTDTPMFIMDSMGAMLKKIERLDIDPNRFVILDPTDEQPPALNFFKINAPPAKQMELFFYLFKAIEQGLTPRQATMISYLVELMQVIPGASLDTLREVCESRQPLYTEHFDQLPRITQGFLQNQFYGKDPFINQTKQQIAARLYTVLRNRTFAEMFGAPENKFDAFRCMQEGKVVLINTDRLYLGDEGSAIFGRFVIAQCLAAALGRASIPEAQRHLALLIVDEAKAYLDDQAEKILSDARQFGLGLILATQSPHQLPDGVQREVANNTSIKMIGGVSYSIASQLARDMHTTPEFIQSMQARPPHAVEFATHVRGLTPNAVKLSIPIGLLEQEPQMTESEWQAMRAANRARYGAETHEAPEGAPRADANRSSEGGSPSIPPRDKVKIEPKQEEAKPSAPDVNSGPDPDL